MWTENCPNHVTLTEIFEVGEEDQFIDNNENKNAIFRSAPFPKRIACACFAVQPMTDSWIYQRTQELYEGP